jgi:transcriptional regulator with XRE-family HTH domain
MKGETIKALRTRLGWTQEQMAAYLCFNHRKEVCRIEAEGATGPTAKLLEKLLDNPAKGIVERARLASPVAASWSPAKLVQVRQRKRMTQAAFGSLLGVSWGYVRDLENGKRRITKRLTRLLRSI